MSRRMTIRIISLAFAISLLGFGFYIKERKTSKNLRLAIQNDYIGSLNSLNSSLNTITDTLNKAVYLESGSDLLSLSTKLYAEGEIAKESLKNLPNGERGSGTLNKFLSQVGNFSMSVSKSLIKGNELTNEQSDNLENLLKTSKKVSKAVYEVNMNYNNLDEFQKMLDEKLDDSVDKKTLASNLDSLEEDLSDYPTLIYDGPFSDHILTKEPLMTSNATEVSKDYCMQKAKEKFGIKNDSLNFDGMQNGKIECYRFSGDNITVSMTKMGGYILYMRKTRDVSDIKITNKSAVNIAKEFMRGIGIENMIESYYFSDEGVCVVNFAYLDGQTICYTDLIKVGVALDNGEIMLFESGGYLTNHTERAFEALDFAEDEAREKLSDKLTVKSTAVALIPTDSAGEVRCYEFLCETEEKQEILVYISTKDLDTKNIFIVEKSDAGTVVK